MQAESQELKRPEVVAVTATVNQLVTLTTNYAITTAEQYAAGADLLKQVKAAQEKLDETSSPIVTPMKTALKALTDFFKAPAEKLTTAETVIKGAMKAYDKQQEDLRLKEQQRANEAARKEREKLQERATKAAASGKTEKAEYLQQAAMTVVAPVINRAPQKVAGISFRENWYAECTDLMALVKAIAAGQAPLSLVMANDKVLGSQARSLKKDFVAPGVRVWSDKNIAAGAA